MSQSIHMYCDTDVAPNNVFENKPSHTHAFEQSNTYYITSVNLDASMADATSEKLSKK